VRLRSALNATRDAQGCTLKLFLSAFSQQSRLSLVRVRGQVNIIVRSPPHPPFCAFELLRRRGNLSGMRLIDGDALLL